MIRTNIDLSKSYRAQARNILDDEYRAVHSTTDHPAVSYGIPHWGDDEGNSFGQIDLASPFVEIISIEVIQNA